MVRKLTPVPAVVATASPPPCPTLQHQRDTVKLMQDGGNADASLGQWLHGEHGRRRGPRRISRQLHRT